MAKVKAGNVVINPQTLWVFQDPQSGRVSLKVESCKGLPPNACWAEVEDAALATALPRIKPLVVETRSTDKGLQANLGLISGTASLAGMRTFSVLNPLTGMKEPKVVALLEDIVLERASFAAADAASNCDFFGAAAPKKVKKGTRK